MSEHRPLTQLLNQWRTGDEELISDIYTAVYTELHRIARSYMYKEAGGHTLQATALVNEAFLRMGDVQVELENRGHFIGIVANTMRQILVDHARAKASQKRGGGIEKVNVDDVDIPTSGPSVDVLALERMLKRLEKTDERKVRIAELYFFCGGTYQEVADAMDVSLATVQRELAMLKALLAKSLQDN